MKLSDFDYNLPKQLIAQHPVKDRQKARMLILKRETGKIEHGFFYQIHRYLKRPDTVVLNNTRVFKARLTGERKGYTGKIELLVLKEGERGIFECLGKPAKRLSKDTELLFGEDLEAIVVDKRNKQLFVRFKTSKPYKAFSKIGLVPLPPYIKREPTKEDERRYQTIYAKKTGAVAAPTAGLHFTESLLNQINKMGVGISYLTLHVGYGTFEPVRCKNIKEHKMFSEYFEINKKSADTINRTKKEKGRILSVGTTVCRTLESAAERNGKSYVVQDKKGETSLFIYPGYRFKMTDILLTNFHLPRTTLLMLVCAFAGKDLVLKAYDEAVKKRYRFYSYGDCMLIL